MPGIVEVTNLNMDEIKKDRVKKPKKKKAATSFEQDQVKVKVAVENQTAEASSKFSIDIISDPVLTDVKIKRKKEKKAKVPTTDATVNSAEKKKKKKRHVDQVEGVEERPAKKIKTSKKALETSEVSAAATSTPVPKKKKKVKADSLAVSPSTPSSLSDTDDFTKDVPTPAKSKQEIEGNFDNFNISKTIRAKLESRGVKYLFPVQSKTFSALMSGHDLIVKARTGSGKTLAFAIPLVEKLQANPDPTYGRLPRALVLSPTRELAKQIGDDFTSIATSTRATCFYGGSAYGPQFGEIRRGIDVLVGTPGRVLDHLSKEGPNVLKLGSLDYVVLDEVDRMLDMGFADDVEKILSSAYDTSARADGKKPQTLLFSATVPSWVRNIANKYLEVDNLKEIDLVGDQDNQTSTTVDHLAVRCVSSARPGIIDVLLRKYGGVAGRKEARAMVFCQTKAECAELSTSPLLTFPRSMLSGDVPQDQRERVMRDFREGKCQCLVATDVAARGLDVPEVDMVIQCSPPQDTDSYIHRSGRTGRAGRRGVCICLYGPNEESRLKQVERQAKVNFTRTPAPKAEDLMELKKDEIIESLKEVSNEARDVFLDSADGLIEAQGAREALATALAALSGIKTCQRSLLTGTENYTTLQITGRGGFRTKGFVFRILETRLGTELKEKVTNVSLTADGDAAVIDVPSADKDMILVEFKSDHREWIEEITEIPTLQEPPPRFGGNRSFGRGSGGFRGRGGGGNRSFGSYGGGNRSFGGSRGGGSKDYPNKKIIF